MGERRIVNLTPSGRPVQHGGSGRAYSKLGCRCDECTAANTLRAREVRERRLARSIPDDVEHGTYSTASNYNCKCARCAETRRQYNATAYQERRKRPLAEGDPRHGTLTGYTAWWCRCEACRAAGAEASRKRNS